MNHYLVEVSHYQEASDHLQDVNAPQKGVKVRIHEEALFLQDNF
jgi:hypothetical protein